MLKYNYLASNSIYVSYSHNKKIIDNYLKACDIIFKKISKLSKKKISKLPSRSDGFKRLN